MYSIELTSLAEKFLKKLPRKDIDTLLKKIYSLRENPFRSLKRLKGKKLWRLRVLKYRVIVDVLVIHQKIVILRIGHRKNIYD